MSILFNGGNDPSTIIFNGTDLSKVIYNGVVVWEKYREIVALDMDNDIPTGISTYPESGENKKMNTCVYTDFTHGEHGGSVEPYNMSVYEIGMTQRDPDNHYEINPYLEPYPSDVGYWLRRQYRNADKTKVDITQYNTCLVEAYLYNMSDPFDPGTMTTGNHQYVLFTMMNNTELRACCGEWTQIGESSWFWDTNTLFPNNSDHAIPNEGYNPLSGDPKPEWWSEVPWNRKLGFALHSWHGSAIGQGARGPIEFSDINNFRTYGQPVKFSVRGLTGERYIRALLMPFSCGSTDNRGGLHFWKVTLNTNICDPNN